MHRILCLIIQSTIHDDEHSFWNCLQESSLQCLFFFVPCMLHSIFCNTSSSGRPQSGTVTVTVSKIKGESKQLFFYQVGLLPELITGQRQLRMFALIVSAHPCCTRKFTCHVMHRVHTLSNKVNNDRSNGHCYSSVWISRFWTFGDPYFSFQKQILFTIISTLSKNEQKINVGS